MEIQYINIQGKLQYFCIFSQLKQFVVVQSVEEFKTGFRAKIKRKKKKSVLGGGNGTSFDKSIPMF
jgi:hypothetical protein